MRVVKRNGDLEDISFDKILTRVKKLGQEANIQINYSSLVMKVIDQLHDKIPTTKIDELTAEQCAVMSTQHPDYGVLAGRIVVSNHQKNTKASFYQIVDELYNFKDVHGNHSPLVSLDLYVISRDMANYIEPMFDFSRDYLIDYFGFKTLERAYLFKLGDKILERPQHMWMRVAIGLHGNNMEAVKETYDLMSQKYFTHATPTLFNAGTPRPQLSSCFLIAMEEDSLDGIYNTLKDCANISKWAGGIGLHIHNIRGSNSLIRGTNGKSTGIVPMLKVFNDTARFINQGGKRNGSFAVYLEPWHPDVEDFLEMKKNHGDEEMKARDLFYALWIPDLFMERVKENGKWSLFCPNECPGLADVYGEAFKDLYEKYESSPNIRKTLNARDLWFKILDAQMETGTPYLLFKDACNKKSNQKNLGTIKSSNLCTEVVQYSDDKETAVCNLASIALPTFVNPLTKQFDYDKLHEVTKVITSNLNRVIDINFYPTEKTRRSNLLHRPIGIGVQGLADTFILMDIAFHSDEAKTVNKLI
ncbi:MAG: ribonucleoside-diphosphate reductase subunit alpha, partial [Alphaproteobacteria bacterium]|nr:ribonucleoside-diphosphate reductase subunit alpha [Alphaproteobacteria bacterium]